MRIILLAIVSSILVASAAAAPKDDIRHVDFRNFAYPWSYPGWSGSLEWISTSERNETRLVNGKWRDSENDAGRDDPSAPFSGLTLESVSYAHLSDSSQEQAIVVLRFDTGGTQYLYFVYIYTMQGSAPKLLGYFHAGDRAASGLYQVYANGGNLVVELFDPDKRIGDCCSDGFVRTRWNWRNTRFEQVGAAEFGTPKSTSRLPVSTFGVHG